MRTFLSGLAGGFTLGYAAVRACDALRDLAAPFAAEAKDAKAYGRERRRLMVASVARSLAAAGWTAFALAPRIRGSETGAERRGRRLLAVGAALVFGSVLDLPCDYIEDHALERRYAMSKQDARAWLVERGKGTVVAAFVTLPVVELFVTMMALAPKRWPLVAAAATMPLLVIANLVAPAFIMPLFNRFDPLGGPIEERLRRLARRYGVGNAHILRVDMSRQTEKANAYVIGLFGTHRIVVGDTLLEHFTDDEIEFVVAHELGHYVNKDIWRAVALGTAATAIVLSTARALAALGGAKGPARAIDALARLFFFANVAGVALGPAVALASRRREWAADRFAVTATNAPQWGISAFTRLRDRNLSEDEQPRWMEVLFSSHPSLRARIRELERLRR